MQSMHTYRAWTNKEGHALGRTQQIGKYNWKVQVDTQFTQ